MDIKCADFNIDVFEAWKKEINSVPTINTNYKNDILKFLKSILNYGMDWYELDFNALYRKITNFTNPNELRKEMSFYTYEEFKKFLEQEDDLMYICLWQTLYFCGLRCGEARGLTWDSIDFKNRRMTISKQVQDNINSVSRVLKVFSELGKKGEEEAYTPRPLYRHFED